eukprot:1196165-Prorocentrum_minimum.AAC.9
MFYHDSAARTQYPHHLRLRRPPVVENAPNSRFLHHTSALPPRDVQLPPSYWGTYTNQGLSKSAMQNKRSSCETRNFRPTLHAPKQRKTLTT